MQVFGGLKRWRRERRKSRGHRVSSGFLPQSLERGTASELVELSRTIGAEGWQAAVRRIVQLDAELLEVERANVWSFHEETSSIHCEGGWVASLRTFEHGATLCEPDLPEYFVALRSERVINMPDVMTDPRCRGLRDYCAARGISSMLDVPVWVEGRLAGVVCHEHVGPMRLWGACEEDFVTCVSQIVASAISARAHGEAASAARRHAFLDTVSCVLSSLDSRQIASRAVSLAVPNLADLALVWVESGEGGVECKAMKHADSATNDLAVRRLLEREAKWRREAPGLANRVVVQGQSLLIPEVAPAVLERYGFEPDDAQVIVQLGMRSCVSVPLTAAGKTFGAMSFWASDRRYDSEDLSLAECFGARLASALANARLYEVARDAIRARDELLVLAAHELRTPLTALQLTADLLLQQSRRGDDAAEAARSEKIGSQVRRFGALVEHILEAMRIRAEGVSIRRAPCDLADVVRECVARMASRARAAASELTVSCPGHLAGVYDRERIATVVCALLDNAVKFGQGQPIAVTLGAEPPWAVLSIRDGGIGFWPERLHGFFDPFERGVEREKYGGLGLGLYVAKAIVDAHGGSITATSRPGEGATFVVRLPLGW